MSAELPTRSQERHGELIDVNNSLFMIPNRVFHGPGCNMQYAPPICASAMKTINNVTLILSNIHLDKRHASALYNRIGPEEIRGVDKRNQIAHRN